MVRILKTRGGVYNADEMGLGKTIQSLSVCETLRFAKVLIICPAVVTLVWREEIKKWCKSIIYFEIMSYDMAAKVAPQLNMQRWDCLILDECHKVKNHETKRSQAIFTHLWPNIRYKICLSGTPFTSNVLDCWTLFSRLAPEYFADYWKFAHRYTHVNRTPFGTKFEGIKNAAELKRLIRSTFFIRRTKEEVLPELPEKTWQKITLPESLAVKMTPEEELEHKKYVQRVIAAFKRGQPIRRAPPVSSATWRKAQGLKKIPYILEFSKNLLDQNIPIILMCYHLDFVNAIRIGLREFNPVVITGETNAKDRESAVRTFQEGGTDCFLGNIQAAGVGITLTRSSTILFGEYSWLPSDMQQCVARAVRIGQKNHVHVYYFVVTGSIEENMLNTVISRAEDFKAILT